MSHTLPTVRIASEHPEHNGFIVINQSDFDPDSHTLFDDAAEPGSDEPKVKRAYKRRAATDDPAA